MQIFSVPVLSEITSCPYFEDRLFQQRYFWGGGLSEEEFQYFLERGWRRFGYFFFKPECPNCQDCTPIRIDVHCFNPSKSLRKIKRKNQETIVVFEERVYREECFTLYQNYQKERFGEESNHKVFKETFYVDGAPGMQASYYYQGVFIGIAYLDCGVTGISSVYFAYNLNYSFLNLGHYSIIKEIEYAKLLGKQYYYPGYFIKELPRMAYKNRFKPHQYYHWDSGEWKEQ